LRHEKEQALAEETQATLAGTKKKKSWKRNRLCNNTVHLANMYSYLKLLYNVCVINHSGKDSFVQYQFLKRIQNVGRTYTVNTTCGHEKE
jgi:hypothetical protein